MYIVIYIYIKTRVSQLQPPVHELKPGEIRWSTPKMLSRRRTLPSLLPGSSALVFPKWGYPSPAEWFIHVSMFMYIYIYQYNPLNMIFSIHDLGLAPVLKKPPIPVIRCGWPTGACAGTEVDNRSQIYRNDHFLSADEVACPWLFQRRSWIDDNVTQPSLLHLQ